MPKSKGFLIRKHDACPNSVFVDEQLLKSIIARLYDQEQSTGYWSAEVCREGAVCPHDAPLLPCCETMLEEAAAQLEWELNDPGLAVAMDAQIPTSVGVQPPALVPGPSPATDVGAPPPTVQVCPPETYEPTTTAPPTSSIVVEAPVVQTWMAPDSRVPQEGAPAQAVGGNSAAPTSAAAPEIGAAMEEMPATTPLVGADEASLR